MSVALVDYLVAREGPPPRRGLAYDYVLAGDGLYLVAENPWLSARVPVARCAVRGLPPLYPACTLRQGPLPQPLWEAIVQTGRALAAAGLEVVLLVRHDPVAGYRLALPPQRVGRTRVTYRPAGDAVLEIHSHHRYPARFSATDDADEQGLRLYGVIGRLDGARPEVALRAGAYGHWLPVPWEDVFVGSRGVFRDVQFEPDSEASGEGDDAVRD